VGVGEQRRQLEQERMAKLAAIRQKEAEEQAKKDPIEYQKNLLVEDWRRKEYQLDYAAVQIQNAAALTAVKPQSSPKRRCRKTKMTIATIRVLDHGTRASLTVCTWNGFQKRVQQAEKDVLPLH